MLKFGTVSTVNMEEHTVKVMLDGVDNVLTADLKIVYHKFQNEVVKYPLYVPCDRVIVALTNGYNGAILGKID